MSLTEREQQIVALLRANPTIASGAIAERLGTTRAAVNVHLSNLGRKGVILGRGYILAERPGAVVIGGANVDVKARSAAPAAPGTSNPGTATMSPGGVGRNIAENLARLGTRTHLIAAVGRDPLGDALVRDTAAAGVHLEYLHRTGTPTGTYTAVLDQDGELVIAVSDMAATAELGPAQLDAARDLIAAAGLLVLDGNLSAEVLRYARDLAAAAGVRTVVEPVSVPKSALLADMFEAGRPVFAVTPNADEVAALTGLPARTGAQRRAAADALHERGVQHVWIRLGRRGSLLSGPAGAIDLPAVPATVTDVTGAGDAMLGAFCHALLEGADPVDAARLGHAAAALTIATTHTVRPDLTARLVRDTMAAGTPAPRTPAPRTPRARHVSQHASPQQASPNPAAPQHTSPQDASPKPATPQHGSPQHTSPHEESIA